MTHFYAGQNDYIDRLNELATVAEVTGVTASAAAAAASATSAAASYDSFDDRYLGSKAVAPTLDNDGVALLIGAIYWDTVTPEMRVWNGTAWIPVQSLSSATTATTQAAAASASATAAAGSATTASTQATNASTSATTATAQATAAAASYDSFDDRYLGSKGTVPTFDNDGNVLLLGAIYWDVTTPEMRVWNGAAWIAVQSLSSATTATTQATAAAASAATASTQANNALTSANNSASSATTASTQATNAAASATTAATQATNASTSATTASTQATNAATSATNAASSLASVNLVFDTFDDRFLGTKTVAPTLDNDGNALVAGTVYYNSVTQTVNFYNGATWEAPAASATASATSAATSATTASTQATNAATSTTSAATSATNAATSATTASTQATNASASATTASTQATNASASATTASTQATNASTSATSAGTSATTATTQATNSSNSAAAALASENAAAASYDSFDDRYLGAKAAAPTLDNDGNALLTGSLYWDTTLPAMRAWTGTTWTTLPTATATSVANTPSGGISATNVQAAINELDNEKQALTGKDATGGYAGLTLFRLNLKNAANTITSWFTTAATAARTWTLPDKDGTVALTIDITGGTSPSAFTSVAVTGTAGVGVLSLVGQSVNPTPPAAGTALVHAVTTNGFTRFEQDNEAPTNLVLGRDSAAIARNTTAAVIPKGSVLYITGTSGNVPSIALARANSATTLPAMFVATDDIAVNAFGQVLRSGALIGVNTSAYASGDRVYASPTVAGGLTNVRPSGVNFAQRVGSVIVAGVGNGSIDINIAPALLNMETGTNAAAWVASGTVAGANLSGTNTGDQTNISGSAATVTAAAQPSITSVGSSLTTSGSLGLRGQAAGGTWTVGGWTKAVSMGAGGTLWWPKGTSATSKGISATNDDLIRFNSSNLDDVTGTITYPFTFDMSTGAFAATGSIISSGSIDSTSGAGVWQINNFKSGSFEIVNRSGGGIISYVGSGALGSTLSTTGLAVVGVMRTSGYTVATLPAGTVGDRAYVTNAVAPTYNGALTGGGTVIIPVFRNAAVWVSA